MPKLYQFRQKRNKFSAHLFEQQTTNLNLQVKVQILLDIEKALAEGNLSEEVKEVDGLILIAMNREKADIEKTNNKTLVEILGGEKKKEEEEEEEEEEEKEVLE